jgi:prevent-host-death family protein
MAGRDVYTNTHEVGVRRFRSELRRWLQIVDGGGEVVVTERGRPLARVTSASRPSRFQELIDAGVIKPARRPKERIVGPGIKARGSISDIVISQRR